MKPLNVAGGFILGAAAGAIAFGLYVAWDALRYEHGEPLPQ